MVIRLTALLLKNHAGANYVLFYVIDIDKNINKGDEMKDDGLKLLIQKIESLSKPTQNQNLLLELYLKAGDRDKEDEKIYKSLLKAETLEIQKRKAQDKASELIRSRKKRERDKDARVKILLGAGLKILADKQDDDAIAVLRKLKTVLNEKDFEVVESEVVKYVDFSVRADDK